MNIAFIGSSGHYNYAIQGIKERQGLFICAIAPGSNDEDISSLKATITQLNPSVNEYSDYKLLLANEKPDIVVVNPYFCYNAKVAIDCLKAGAHVYLEKPVATTLKDLDELMAAYEKCGKSLCAMFGIRYTKWFQTALSATQSGLIGEVRMLMGQKSYKLGKRGALYRDRALYGGTIPWVACHAVDWVRCLSGQEFISVSAHHSTKGNDDHGDLEATSAMLFSMTDGVIATVTADYLRPKGAMRHDDDRVRIVGTKGTIEAYDGAVYIEKENTIGKHQLPLIDEKQPFLEFIDAIGTNVAHIFAQDAFAVTKACLYARQAADTKKIQFII